MPNQNKPNQNRQTLGKSIAELKNRMHQKKNGTWLLYMILRLAVIGFAVRAIFMRRFEYLAICALVLGLFLVPSLLEKQLKIEIPSGLEKVVLLFAFAAEILGEMQAFYITFPWWDTMLHTMNGFLCAAVGFAFCNSCHRLTSIAELPRPAR